MEDKELYTVLSIDGGGIRGILPLLVLAEIEKRLGRPISDAIDLAAGTSTGGIIAAGLTAPHPVRQDQPRFKAMDLVGFYLNDGPEIFEKGVFSRLRSLFRPKYSSAPLEASLRRFFGDTRLEDSLTSIMLTAYDIETRESVFMRHFKDHPDGNAERRWKVRDATLATSSAPTYFKPARVRSYAPKGAGSNDEPAIMEHTLVDGGIFVQNPAAAAYFAGSKEAEQRDAEMFVISLGTGSLTRAFKYEDAKRWGGLGWINPNNDVPVLNASFDAQSSAANQHMEFMLGDQFIRLEEPLRDDEDPKLSPNDAFDDASPENMAKLQRFADRMIKQNTDKIDVIVDVLKSRMHQKDLGRGPRPRPDAELAAAVRDNEPDDIRSRMKGWLRGAGLWPEEQQTPKDLGWDSNELDTRRRHDKDSDKQEPTTGRRRRTMPAEESELEALRALAHRFGQMAGKKGKDIDTEIDEALEAARTAAERDRQAAAESAEALAEIEGNRSDGGPPEITRVVHSDDLDAPPPANENGEIVDQGVIDALVEGDGEDTPDEERPVSWRQPLPPEGRGTSGPGRGP
ncbi:MAG: patatin-like phospholipase family protein [Alphaproteobacteria bacterium]|nr:patatin-like phospholipase family protein [Alphaproteobacteria bacterium SS10]